MLFSVQIRVHRKFAVEEGDHLTMLNVYEAFVKVSTAVPAEVPSAHPEAQFMKARPRDLFIFPADYCQYV